MEHEPALPPKTARPAWIAIGLLVVILIGLFSLQTLVALSGE